MECEHPELKIVEQNQTIYSLWQKFKDTFQKPKDVPLNAYVSIIIWCCCVIMHSYVAGLT